MANATPMRRTNPLMAMSLDVAQEPGASSPPRREDD